MYKALRAAGIHSHRFRDFKEDLKFFGLRAAELSVRQYIWFKNKKGYSDVEIERFLKRR